MDDIYDVTVYASFGTRVSGVEAESPEEAASKAIAGLNLHAIADSVAPFAGGGEEFLYTDEVIEALVDVAGDGGYHLSTWLTVGAGPPRLMLRTSPDDRPIDDLFISATPAAMEAWEKIAASFRPQTTEQSEARDGLVGFIRKVSYIVRKQYSGTNTMTTGGSE